MVKESQARDDISDSPLIKSIYKKQAPGGPKIEVRVAKGQEPILVSLTKKESTYASKRAQMMEAFARDAE
jgi:hypothetical protein